LVISSWKINNFIISIINKKRDRPQTITGELSRSGGRKDNKIAKPKPPWRFINLFGSLRSITLSENEEKEYDDDDQIDIKEEKKSDQNETISARICYLPLSSLLR